MAKAPAKKVTGKSNKPLNGVTKKPPVKRKKPLPLLLDPDPCEACNPCAGMETGTTGLLWCDGAGAEHVLVFTGGEKVVGWNSNGPYWRNPDTTPGGA